MGQRCACVPATHTHSPVLGAQQRAGQAALFRRIVRILTTCRPCTMQAGPRQGQDLLRVKVTAGESQTDGVRQLKTDKLGPLEFQEHLRHWESQLHPHRGPGCRGHGVGCGWMVGSRWQGGTGSGLGWVDKNHWAGQEVRGQEIEAWIHVFGQNMRWQLAASQCPW